MSNPTPPVCLPPPPHYPCHEALNTFCAPHLLYPSAALQVLVSGSETTGEHRVQIWTPYYLQNGRPRPTITSAPTTVSYGQNITVKYSGVSSIDRVVLNRVVGATDSNHMDQRQVVLTGASSAGSQHPPTATLHPLGSTTFLCCLRVSLARLLMCHCSFQHQLQKLLAPRDERLSFNQQSIDLIVLSKLSAVSQMQDGLCRVREHLCILTESR